MGHRAPRDIYRRLGRKIDHLTMRAPWNETFRSLLESLYSPEEADLVVRMPYGLSTFERITAVTGHEPAGLRRLLDRLCSKGLVVDLWMGGAYRYIPSPIVIGIFEFTMMRAGEGLDRKAWASLFHQYLEEDPAFFAANCKGGQGVSIMRTLPHEEAVRPSEHTEILDYEKAEALIREADRFCLGICSCRHEKHHLGQKFCDTPLETCTSLGTAADYLIRRNLAREISRAEMLDILARSRDTGLVLNADNVRRRISFICHCCKCCCHALRGIRRFGYDNIVITSNFLAESDPETCVGCGRCAEACPIEAIRMVPVQGAGGPARKKKGDPRIDRSFCLGCGVCALQCKTGALRLVPRGQRVLHPETTLERVILQCLEKGTLQYQIFDDPRSYTQKFMRLFVGAFLRLPSVKRGLMSETFRSSFLAFLAGGLRKQGKKGLSEV